MTMDNFYWSETANSTPCKKNEILQYQLCEPHPHHHHHQNIDDNCLSFKYCLLQNSKVTKDNLQDSNSIFDENWLE